MDWRINDLARSRSDLDGSGSPGIDTGYSFRIRMNLAIVARWVWTEAFAPGLSDVFATVAILTWLAGFAYTLWWVWLCHPQRYRQEIERLFRDAMEAYLQGHWNDSRKRIERILAIDETDADALLQLGTLHVRLHQPARSACFPPVSGVRGRCKMAMGDRASTGAIE